MAKLKPAIEISSKKSRAKVYLTQLNPEYVYPLDLCDLPPGIYTIQGKHSTYHLDVVKSSLPVKKEKQKRTNKILVTDKYATKYGTAKIIQSADSGEWTLYGVSLNLDFIHLFGNQILITVRQMWDETLDEAIEKEIKGH